jgi:hypothetical protein
MNYVEKENSKNKDINISIDKLERQAQKNLNSRLDKMRFRNYTAAEFASTAPHSSTDISFVTATDGTVSLYKGDTLLSGEGSDVSYALLTGFGTGLGGEPGSRNELSNIRYTSSPAREEINEGEVLSTYTDNIHYWINSNGYNEQYDRNGQNKTLSVKGYGDFISSLSNSSKWFYIICNGHKALIYPGLRSVNNGGRVANGLSYLSSVPKGDFYVRRAGSSVREHIEYQVEPYSVGFYKSPIHSGNIRERSTTGPADICYKIKVTRTAVNTSQTRYINYELYNAGYTRRNINAVTPDWYIGVGAILGFESVEKNEANSLYGQLQGPCFLAHSSNNLYHIKETSDNPYGLFYDIDTGDALPAPLVEFQSTSEKTLAYIAGLGVNTPI